MPAPYGGDVPLSNGRQESPAARQDVHNASGRKKGGQMNAHHNGTTGRLTTAKNRRQPMTLLTYTLAPDVPSSPVRSRHAPWVGHAVSAIAVVAAGLLGALAGVLIGLVAGILLAGPEATRLMTLGGEELNIISRGLRAVARDVPDGRSPPTVRAPTSHASHRNLTDGAKTA
jgi:hypothetical protein